MTTRKLTFPGDSSGFSNPLNDRIKSIVISSVVERSPKAKQFYPCQAPTQSCHSERSGESTGKDTAYTPRRDDIQRLALMIYSHKWLMIYTPSRDYGVKRKSITLFHHNVLYGISSAMTLSKALAYIKILQRIYIDACDSTYKKKGAFQPPFFYN